MAIIAKSRMELQQLKKLLLPTVDTVHYDWLEALIGHQWLDKCMNNPHARKLLNRRLHSHYDIEVPQKHDLSPHQQWLLLNVTQQNDLAMELGKRVSIPYLRKLISQQEVKLAQQQLGVDQYQSLLQQEAIDVSGTYLVDGHEGCIDVLLCNALQEQRLEKVLVSVGIGVLENTVSEQQAFFQLRMRFAFPRHCWKQRPSIQVLNQAELEQWLIRKIAPLLETTQVESENDAQV
ncbi:MAG: hypothetical protein ACRBHB_26265 [Arenicella sp.]